MNAIATRKYPDWNRFWDRLDAAESVWSRKCSEEDRASFESLIEEMLTASTPHEPFETLRASWQTLGLGQIEFSQDHDLLWNLLDAFQSPEQSADTVLKTLRTELYRPDAEHASPVNGADRTGGTDEPLQRFWKDLTHAALFTLWRFQERFPNYLGGLPMDVANSLREHLYGMTVFALLGRLS